MSGYTTFVGGTVLEHGKLWTARLLDLIADRIRPPLRLSAIEGDSLLFYGRVPAPDGTIVPLLLDIYHDFRRVAETIEPCTDCVCNACDSGKDLQLKYIVHAGSFVEQSVAGLVQLYEHDRQRRLPSAEEPQSRQALRLRHRCRGASRSARW